MRSTSSLTINWIQPELAAEKWEFFHHPAKQPFYVQHSLGWNTLAAAFESGRLTPFPRSRLLNGIPVALSYHSFDDYCRYLAKARRGYRRNYSLMEEELQRCGSLKLPAPIVIQAKESALLFAGYRRLCLAWNYGMIPYVWLVDISNGG